MNNVKSKFDNIISITNDNLYTPNKMHYNFPVLYK